MIIALPIEIKSREYLPKLFLAYEILKKTKHQIIIGKKSEIYSIYKNSKNIFLILKGGPKKKFPFKVSSLKKNIFSILDEEGPLVNLRFRDFKNRCSDDVLKKCDYYFSWGAKDKKFLKNNTKIKCKILNFGHPKFDLVKKNKKYFKKFEKQISKKYKRFVLFSSNFHQDQIMDNKEYLSWRGKQANEEKKFLKSSKIILEIDFKLYLKTISYFKTLAKKNPKINFLFRPHPRQNIDLVKKRFGKLTKNLFIEKKYPVTSYINACSLFMHRGCTTVLEAAQLNKKIIYLKKFNYNKKKWLDSFGMTIDNQKNDLKYLPIFLNKKENKKLKYNNSIIYNLNSKSFYNEIVKFFNRKSFNSVNSNLYKFKYNLNNNFINEKKSIIKKFLIKNKILNKFLLDYNEDYVLPKEYLVAKFNRLTSKEIQKDFNNFFKEDKKKRNYKITQVHKNSYLLNNN